ncbi:hypothetical protein ACL2XP_17405 [Sodalis sp. RH21]|uniref:hypothetical protein n=1 Tax=unclassified Sodalis (in: enterobacteria) TaxID=2636512 RepID=UPI0039B6B851
MITIPARLSPAAPNAGFPAPAEVFPDLLPVRAMTPRGGAAVDADAGPESGRFSLCDGFDDLGDIDIADWPAAPARASATYVNLRQPDKSPPPVYPGAAAPKAQYAQALKTFITGSLLNEVNRAGRAPLWLRPFAAVCGWLGVHGVGQTNCMSCATAVADTVKQGMVHYAHPALRGGTHSQFATLRDAAGTLLSSSGELAARLLAERGDLNGVLTITRPRSWWRRVFSPVDGHACNLIKTGRTLHLLDTQKKIYVTVDIPAGAAALELALGRFIGAAARHDGSLRLDNVGF